MLNFISGHGLGLFNHQSNPVAGQTTSSNGLSVNLLNGNLVIQRQDELIKAGGSDFNALTTYNSQGQLANPDNYFSHGFSGRVRLVSGTANTAGSVAERLTAGGYWQRFTYNAQTARYESTEGEGAHDYLTRVSSGWLYTEGSTSMQHYYGRQVNGEHYLSNITDPDGNELVILYDANNRVSMVTDEQGQNLEYVYENDRLSAYRYVDENDDTNQTRTYFTYDNLGRLEKVIVDLTPEDGSISDGRVFETQYFYDGGSERIHRILQSDGQSWRFRYDSQGRVNFAQSGEGAEATAMEFAYSGQSTYVYHHVDGERQMRQIFGWNRDGTLAFYTGAPDDRGRSVSTTYSYNENQQLTEARTSLGDATTRDYNDAGFLIAESFPDGLSREYQYDDSGTLVERLIDIGRDGTRQVTQFYYDEWRQLRFTLGADGSLQETRYVSRNPATGRGKTGISRWVLSQTYVQSYDTHNRYSTEVFEQLVANATAEDVRNRTAVGLDYRDQVREELVFDLNAENGLTEVLRQSLYIYDGYGNLLEKVEPATDSQSARAEYYAYDGLGRQIAFTDALGGMSTVDYQGNRITRQTQAGLTTISTYDSRGVLIDEVKQDRFDNQRQLQATQFHYDQYGRLKAQEDANGLTHYLYDRKGRLALTVNALGEATRNSYDNKDRLIKVEQLANSVELDSLLSDYTSAVTRDDASYLTNVQFITLDPARDRVEHYYYNEQGILSYTLDADGYLTAFHHDGFNRQIAHEQFTRSYYNDEQSTAPTSFITINNFAESLRQEHESGNVNLLRMARDFYDAGNNLLGQLDYEGYFTQFEYNDLDQRVMEIRVADQQNVFTANGKVNRSRYLNASVYDFNGYGVFDDFDAARNSQVRFFLYDQQGLQRAQVNMSIHEDVDGGTAVQTTVSLIDYDDRGNVQKTVDLGQIFQPESNDQDGFFNLLMQFVGLSGGLSNMRIGRFDVVDSLMDFESLKAAANNYMVDYEYDELDRLIVKRTNEGLQENYHYDERYQLSEIIRTSNRGDSGTSEKRVTQYAFNALGQQTKQVKGEQVLAESVANDAAFQDRVAAQQGKENVYNSQGYLIKSYDTNGNATRYFYNALGQLVYRVDAGNYVISYQYNRFGELTETFEHGLRMTNPAYQAAINNDTDGALGLSTEQLAQYLPNSSYYDRVTTQHYNRRGLLAGGTSALSAKKNINNQFEYQYNAFGQQVRSEERIGRHANSVVTAVTTRDYDLRGNVVNQERFKASAPLQKRVYSAVYDAFGRLVNELTESGSSNRFVYDGRNHLLLQSGDHLDTVSYQYDAHGRQTQMTNELGHALRYEYDFATGEIKTITAEGIETVEKRNAFGDVTERRSGEGVVDTLHYDSAGRLERTVTAGVETINVYDANDNIRQVIQGRNVTDYTYNNLNQVYFETRDFGGQNLRTRHHYNAFGELTTAYDYANRVNNAKLRDQAGNVTMNLQYGGTGVRESFSYDNRSRVAYYNNYSFENGRSNTSSRNSTAYNVFDEAETVSHFGDGPSRIERFFYNDHGQLTRQVDAQGQEHRFVYGDDGEVALAFHGLRVEDGTLLFSVVEYERDALGRLSRTTAHAEALAFNTATTLEQWREILSQMADSDRSTRYFYDKDNRQRFIVGAEGGIKEFIYNKDNAVIREVAHKIGFADLQARAGNGFPQDNAASTLEAQLRESDYHLARQTFTFYDEHGRMSGSIDAVGGLRTYRYNEHGQLVHVKHFANPVGSDWRDFRDLPPFFDMNADMIESFWGVADSDDLQEFFSYNSLGQRTHHFELAGSSRDQGSLLARVSTLDYDAFGNVKAQRQFSNYLVEKDRAAWNNLLEKLISSAGNADAVADITWDNHEHDRVQTWTYDKMNRLVAERAVNGLVTEYTLDSAGRRVGTKQIARDGEVRQELVTYNDFGDLVQRVDAQLLRELGYSDDQADNLDSELGHTFTVDSKGLKVAATDAEGNRSVFYYQHNGLLRLKVSAGGEVTEFTYNAFGEQTQRSQWTKRYKGDVDALTGGRITSAVVSQLRAGTQFGQHAQWEYHDAAQSGENARDLVNTAESIAGVESVSESTEYNRLGQVTERRNDAVITKNEYNDFGELKSVAKAVNEGLASQFKQEKSFVYDRLGRVYASTQVGSDIVAKSYNGLGHLLSETRRGGSVSEYDRNGFGQVESTTKGESIETDFVVKRFYQYDAFGRRQEMRVENSQYREAYSYDPLTNTETVTLPSGVQTKTVFNDFGETIEIRDRDDRIIEAFTFDANGNRLSRTDAKGNVESSTFDNNGQRLTYTDANGNRTEWIYDSENRVFMESRFDGGKRHDTRYFYDGAGRLSMEINAIGVPTLYTYDADNRNTEVLVDPDGLALLTLREFDERGNVILEQKGERLQNGENRILRAVAYEYDDNNRRAARTADPEGEAIRTTQRFDDAGNLLEETSALGISTFHYYNDLNQKILTLEAAELPELASSEIRYRVQSFHYDKLGNQTDSIHYDRLIAQSSLPQHTDPDAISTVLSRVRGGTRREQFFFDADGRLLYHIDPKGTIKAHLYNRFGQLATVSQYAFNYGVSSLYSAEAVTGAIANFRQNVSASELAEGVIEDHYRYDAMGRQTHHKDGAGYVSQLRYDGVGNVIEETRFARPQPGSTLNINAILIDAENDRTTRQSFDAAGRLTHRVDASGALTEFQRDALGNVIKTIHYATRLDTLPSADEAIVPPAESTGDRTVSARYDAAGRKNVEQDALGYVNISKFNALGQITEKHHLYVAQDDILITENLDNSPEDWVRDELDRIETRVYNDLGQLERIYQGRNEAGVPYKQYRYNDLGKVIYEIDFNGSFVHSLYNDIGQKTREIRQADHTARRFAYITDYEYDARGNVRFETQYASKVRTREFIVRSATDRSYVEIPVDDIQPVTNSSAHNGDRVFEYRYDKLNRRHISILPSIDNQAGTVIRDTFDAFGNLITHVEAYGTSEAVETRFTYDKLGNKLSQIKAVNTLDEATTRFTYNAFGEMESTTDPRAEAYIAADTVEAIRFLDEHGFIQLSQHWSGFISGYSRLTINNSELAELLTQLKLEVDSQLSDSEKVQIQRLFTTEFVYDKQGNKIAELSPNWQGRDNLRLHDDQAIKSFDYNAFGDVVRITDENGGQEHFFRDNLGRVRVNVNASDFAIHYSYDANGNVLWESQLATRLLPSVLESADSYQELSDQLRYDMYNDLYTGFTYDAQGRVKTKKVLVMPHSLPEREQPVQINPNDLEDLTQIYQKLPELIPDLYNNDILIRELNETLIQSSTPAQFGTFVQEVVSQSLTQQRLTGLRTNLIKPIVVPNLVSSTRALSGVLATQTTANGIPVLMNVIGDPSAANATNLANASNLLASDYHFVDGQIGQYSEIVRLSPVHNLVDSILAHQQGSIAQQEAVTDLTRFIASIPVNEITQGAFIDFGLNPIFSTLTESFDYDAMGNVTEYTDRNAQTYEYHYDALGRKVREYKPEAEVITSVHESGDTRQNLRIQNRFEYDRLNNLIRQHEAYNLQSQTRTTEYVYDKLGRNTRIIYKDKTFIKSPDNTRSDTTVFTEDLEEVFEYDRHGNVIREKDLSGNYTNRYYNARNEEIAFVDQGGYVTEYQHDAKGNRIKETQWANPIRTVNIQAPINVIDLVSNPAYDIDWDDVGLYPNLADPLIGNNLSNPLVNQFLGFSYQFHIIGDPTAFLADHISVIDEDSLTFQFGRPNWPEVEPNPLEDRTVRFEYDASDRVIKTATGPALTYDTTYGFRHGEIVNEFEYDDKGNLVLAIDGNGNRTYRMYDSLGNEIYSMDAEGSIIMKQYQDGQRVSNERKLANKGNGTLRSHFSRGDMLRVSSEIIKLLDADDRVLEFDYNNLGQLIRETQVDIEFKSLSMFLNQESRANLAPAIANDENGSIDTYYFYDALGNRIKSQRVYGNQYDEGDASHWEYDELGRKRKESSGAFTDFRGNTVRETIRYHYDAHGDIAVTTKVGESGLSQSAREDFPTIDDRTYRFVRNRDGNIVEEFTAGKDHIINDYDKNGNLSRKMEFLERSNGLVTADTTRFYYDARGNHRATKIPGMGFLDVHGTNAFGESSGRGRRNLGNARTTVWLEQRYNNVGQLRYGVTDQGVKQVYYYDRNGNRTLTLSVNGEDPVSSLLGEGFQNLANLENLSLMKSSLNIVENPIEIDVYDRANRKIHHVATPLNTRSITNISPALTQIDAYTNAVVATITGTVRGEIDELRIASIEYNAFGEKESYTDFKNHQYRYHYDKRGLLTKTVMPEIQYLDSSRFSDSWLTNKPLQSGAAEDITYFDYMGREIGGLDARGNLKAFKLYREGRLQGEFKEEGRANFTTYTYNAMGELHEEKQSVGNVRHISYGNYQTDVVLDYLTKTYHYDAYGNRSRIVRALESNGNFGEDISDFYFRLLTVDESFIYNSKGQQINRWINLGNWRYAEQEYDYDGLNRVVYHSDAYNHVSRYEYDYNNQNGNVTHVKIKERSGTRTSDVFDYFDRLRSHYDMAGRQTSYDYNDLGQLSASTKVMPETRQEYVYYDNGQLKEKKNSLDQRIYFADYDRNNNLTLEEHYDIAWDGTRGNFYRTTAGYNARNQLNFLSGNGWGTYYNYDQMGNRTRVVTTDSRQSVPKTEEKFYRFDNLNRLEAVSDQRRNKLFRLSYYHYNNLDQRTLTFGHTNNAPAGVGSFTDNETTEMLEYDVLGRVAARKLSGIRKQMKLADNLVDYVMTEADAMDTVENVRTYNAITGNLIDSIQRKKGELIKHDYHSYNAAGDILEVYNRLGEASDESNFNRMEYRYNDNGTLREVQTYGAKRGKDSIDNFIQSYTYESYDDFVVKRETQVMDGQSHVGIKDYKDSGELISFHEFQQGGDDNQNSTRYYYYSHDGKIARTRDTSTRDTGTSHMTHLYFKGNRVGHLGIDRRDGTKYVSELDYSERPGDFDSVIKGSDTYTVRRNETLGSIAFTLWGDASLWYILADANGMSSDRALAENSVLVVPQTFTSQNNNVATFKPYDAQFVEGENSLEVPTPPVKGPNACKQAVVIISAVVIAIAAAVVSVVSLGSATGFAGVAAAAGIGALVGWAADAALQGIMIALDMQDSFDFGQSFGAIAGGAVSGALGGLGNVIKVADIAKGIRFTLQIARIGVQSFAASQVSHYATKGAYKAKAKTRWGLNKTERDNFDDLKAYEKERNLGRSFLASAATSYAGAAIGSLPSPSSGMGYVMHRGFVAVTGSVVEETINHKVMGTEFSLLNIGINSAKSFGSTVASEYAKSAVDQYRFNKKQEAIREQEEKIRSSFRQQAIRRLYSPEAANEAYREMGQGLDGNPAPIAADENLLIDEEYAQLANDIVQLVDENIIPSTPYNDLITQMAVAGNEAAIAERQRIIQSNYSASEASPLRQYIEAEAANKERWAIKLKAEADRFRDLSLVDTFASREEALAGLGDGWQHVVEHSESFSLNWVATANHPDGFPQIVVDGDPATRFHEYFNDNPDYDLRLSVKQLEAGVTYNMHNENWMSMVGGMAAVASYHVADAFLLGAVNHVDTASVKYKNNEIGLGEFALELGYAGVKAGAGLLAGRAMGMGLTAARGLSMSGRVVSSAVARGVSMNTASRVFGTSGVAAFERGVAAALPGLTADTVALGIDHTRRFAFPDQNHAAPSFAAFAQSAVIGQASTFAAKSIVRGVGKLLGKGPNVSTETSLSRGAELRQKWGDASPERTALLENAISANKSGKAGGVSRQHSIATNARLSAGKSPGEQLRIKWGSDLDAVSRQREKLSVMQQARNTQGRNQGRLLGQMLRDGRQVSIGSASPSRSPSLGIQNRGYRINTGKDIISPERQLTREAFNALQSQTRATGKGLQLQLDNQIANREFVYRYTTSGMVENYRSAGRISGYGGSDTFLTTDYLGLDQGLVMEQSQVFSHWGEPDVMLRIPTSALGPATVPRPFGNSLSTGWEPNVSYYPGAGIGGANQFMGTTTSFDDAWIVPLINKKGK